MSSGGNRDPGGLVRASGTEPYLRSGPAGRAAPGPLEVRPLTLVVQLTRTLGKRTFVSAPDPWPRRSYPV